MNWQPSEVSENMKPEMQPLCEHCVHLHASNSVEDDGPLSSFHCENNQTMSRQKN